MKFEWDEKKRKSNINKHGFDFVDAEKVFEGATFTIEEITARKDIFLLGC